MLINNCVLPENRYPIIAIILFGFFFDFLNFITKKMSIRAVMVTINGRK